MGGGGDTVITPANSWPWVVHPSFQKSVYTYGPAAGAGEHMHFHFCCVTIHQLFISKKTSIEASWL